MVKRVACIFIIFLVNACTLKQKQQLNPPQPEASATTIAEALQLKHTSLQSKTGIYMLESGGKSLAARLWLISHAKTSVQIQYFSFAKDKTGLIVCDELIKAADRGVSVRILIDDAARRMTTKELKLLDSHENIEVRVYNPSALLISRHGKMRSRIRNSNHILRRMHNKIITVDELICITGGRNIADAYFDFEKKYNFRDRDVLLIGKVVESACESFDQFWNDTITASALELKQMNKKERIGDVSRFNSIHGDANKTYSASLKELVKTFPEELKTAEKNKMLVWSEQTSYVSDGPGENRSKNNGSTCTDSLIQLLLQAKTSIDIQTPYLITTERGMDLIKVLRKKGIEIRILTNSLASIDNIEAFSAYQKCRAELLKEGVLLYEYKPDAAIRYKLMIPEVQQQVGYRSVYGFHPKSITIDKKICVVGSYNFDPRSADYNTECICIIRSEEVTKILQATFDEEFLSENSWRVYDDRNPDIEAGMKRRIQAFGNRIFPKRIL